MLNIDPLITLVSVVSKMKPLTVDVVDKRKIKVSWRLDCSDKVSFLDKKVFRTNLISFQTLRKKINLNINLYVNSR
jgi:hypothetical protein